MYIYIYLKSSQNAKNKLEILFAIHVHNGERTVSLTNCVGETGQPHAKECNWTTILHYIQKLTENGLKT